MDSDDESTSSPECTLYHFVNIADSKKSPCQLPCFKTDEIPRWKNNCYCIAGFVVALGYLGIIGYILCVIFGIGATPYSYVDCPTCSPTFDGYFFGFTK